MPSAAHAEEQFSEIEEAVGILARGTRPFCESLDLFSTWHQRLTKKAILRPLELKDVRHFCIEAIALKETVEPYKTPWAQKIFLNIMAADEPLSAIDQIMTADGDIRQDASEKMFRLWTEKNQQARMITNILDRVLRNHQLESSLQEKYVTTREGRWVLPIKSNMRHALEGIIHAQSQSKQTVFVEPQEVVPLNNRIREIEIEIEVEIERLLTELSEYLATRITDFEKTRNALLEFDIRAAQANLASLLDAKPVKFTEKEIELKQLRHPLLVLNHVKVVPNDAELKGDHRILLLSGPNAGGKTVLLKAIGIAAQMARCGLLVAVGTHSKLPFFKNIVSSVGDEQSVDQNLSTFAAHLKVLDAATRVKGPDSLLLIDEICGSTDPEEGSALARSFIERYAANGVFAVITSHLGQLKSGWAPESGVMNGSLEFDKERGPTYKFLMGIAGPSLAIQTAKRVGVDPSIIEQALKNLSPEARQYQKNIEQVENMRQELSRLQESLEEEKKRTKKEREKFEAIIARFQKEKEEMLNQSIKRAEKKVENLIRESKIDDIFKRHQKLEQIKIDLPNIVKARSSSPATTAPITTDQEFAKAFPPGSKVFIPSLGYDGIVQGKPNAKGEVPVLSRSIRLMLPWQQLKAPESAKNPTKDILRKSSHYSFMPGQQDRVVDVRGLTVEEAIEQLELQLDTASLNQEDRVKIIHGHGTDTLKKAIRSYLSRSVYVKKWQAGNAETGGDGITWAEVKE